MKKLYTFLVLALLVPNISNAQTPCDQPNGSQGFPEIPACEAAVCEYDDFCCIGAWDAMCAIYSGMFEPCYPCVLGSDLSYLSGHIFADINCNGIFDIDEYIIHNHAISAIPYAQTSATVANYGLYNAILNNGVNYFISAAPLNGFTISNSQNIQVPNNTTIIEDVDFGLCPIPGYFDGGVEVSQSNIMLWSLSSVETVSFVVKNNSGWNISGQAMLNFNPIFMQLISTSGAVNNGQITWDIEDLEPFEISVLTASFSPLSVGLHNFSSTFLMNETIGLDANLLNNNANYNPQVIGDFGSPFCDAPQSGPGFPIYLPCEQAVCALDDFCCNNSWDGACALLAFQLPECIPCLTSPSSSSIASGFVFFDENCNETLDNGEMTIPGVFVNTDGIVSGYSNSAGLYFSVLQNYSTQTLTVNSLPGFISNSITLNTDSSQTYTEMNIGYCPISPVSNVGVSLSPSGPPPRPGFPMTYIVCITNFGSTTASANIEFDFADMANCTVLQPGEGTVNGTLIEFDAIELNIFETLCFSVVMQVPVGTPAGTLLNPSVIANLQPNPLDDADLSNNVHTLHQEVVAAYDPNDKTVNFPVVNHTEIPAGQGTELEYLIRFQNTGNFYATYVRVVDELPDLLDISTIHMINASHDYELSFPEPNVLEWFFDEIMLPDSTTDEPGSHGFIHFRIRTVAGVELDDIIENNASIYFDFKAPIITEYAVTTFMDCSEGSLQVNIPNTVCQGEEFLLTSNRDDFANYEWLVDGQLLSGQEIITMLFESSTVQLTAVHPVCTLSTSLEVEVVLPPTMNIILAPYVSCNGPMEIDLDCSGSLTWYLNESVQGTGEPFVAPLTGLYDVYCENACGGMAANIEVYIYETPEVNIELDENGTLTASPSGATYIWYFNGAPVIGASGQSIVPELSGNYSVTVIFANGCGATSEILFVPVSVGEELADKIHLFPNPANENVMLELPQGNWQVSLTDITGKTLLENQILTEGRHNINLNALSGGMYLIRISSEAGSVVKKLMVR